jgi:hypothetical protein
MKQRPVIALAHRSLLRLMITLRILDGAKYLDMIWYRVDVDEYVLDCGLWRGNPLACSAFASYQSEPMASWLAHDCFWSSSFGFEPRLGGVRLSTAFTRSTMI